MRVKDVILSLVSVALIGAGIVLVAFFFLGSNAGGDNSSNDTEDFDVPVLVKDDGEGKDASGGAGGGETASAPEDKTLFLTIPKMERIVGATIPDAEGDDEEKLKDYAAIHLQGTGFPWESGANVYIAGHRLGFPYTNSFLAFYDLNKLDVGDEVKVTDAEGRAYAYRVLGRSLANPTDLSIAEPVEGKDVLTLQTCTLPDYSERLIVQAEKVA